MIAFSSKSSFAMIDLTLNFFKCINQSYSRLLQQLQSCFFYYATIYIKKFHNSCKAASSTECNYYSSDIVVTLQTLQQCYCKIWCCMNSMILISNKFHQIKVVIIMRKNILCVLGFLFLIYTNITKS